MSGTLSADGRSAVSGHHVRRNPFMTGPAWQDRTDIVSGRPYYGVERLEVRRTDGRTRRRTTASGRTPAASGSWP